MLGKQSTALGWEVTKLHNNLKCVISSLSISFRGKLGKSLTTIKIWGVGVKKKQEILLSITEGRVYDEM